MRMHHFWAPNGSFAPNKTLFGKKLLISFSSTYWTVSLCKIFKKFLEQIQSYEDASFLGAKWFICPKQNFIWKKSLISFSSTYWTVSFSKILKKLLKLIQIYEDVPLSDPKYSNLSWTKFFGTNHYYYFHLPIGPFHCAKFKKILTADPELWGCAIFGPKMVHLPQTNFFLENY